VQGTTLRDHREHHPGMCNWRSCRPLLSLGQRKFLAKTTKTTPFESKWKEVKERARVGTGCRGGREYKNSVQDGATLEIVLLPVWVGQRHVRPSNPPHYQATEGCESAVLDLQVWAWSWDCDLQQGVAGSRLPRAVRSEVVATLPFKLPC